MSPNGWSKRIPNPPKIYKNPSLDSYVSPWVPLGTPGSLKWCSKAPKWCPNGVPIAPRFKSSEARVIKSSGGQKEGGRRQGRSLENPPPPSSGRVEWRAGLFFQVLVLNLLSPGPSAMPPAPPLQQNFAMLWGLKFSFEI